MSSLNLYTENLLTSAIESSSWGWFNFLYVPNEFALDQYLIDGKDNKDGILSIKASVKVYSCIDDSINRKYLIDVIHKMYVHEITIKTADEEDNYADKVNKGHSKKKKSRNTLNLDWNVATVESQKIELKIE